MTTPINPVTADGILAIQCQIWNMRDEYNVDILRAVNKGTEQITNGVNYNLVNRT